MVLRHWLCLTCGFVAFIISNPSTHEDMVVTKRMNAMLFLMEKDLLSHMKNVWRLGTKILNGR